ncbi:MAG: AI-2E family transporter [Clostridia bacterium]|nr:AI-2E family transporter [Clostridia bacterium]
MKKPHRDHSTRRAMLLIAFGVLLFALVQNLSAVGKFLGWLMGLIYPLILGLCIAFVLNVVMRAFENRLLRRMADSPRPFVRRLRRPLALVLTILTFLIVIALVLLVVVPGIGETVNSLIPTVQRWIDSALPRLVALLEKYNISADLIAELKVDWNNLFSTVFDVLKNGTGSFFDFAAAFTTSIFGGLANFFLGLILAIYILLGKEQIAAALDRVMSAFLPDAVTAKVEEIGRLCDRTFSNFLTGQLTEAFILGGLCCIGMLIFGFPYAGIVSVLVGVSALIPVFGAFIGGGVSAFLILTVNPLKALLFIVFLVILQQLENNLIYPRVVGKKVGLPGILVIIAVLIGGNIGGILTILISVPLCSVLYTLFGQLVEYRLTRAKAEEAETPASPPVPESEPAPAPVLPKPAKKGKGKKR